MAKKTVGDLVSGICNTGVIIGDLYRHYLGNLYKVEDIVCDSDDGTPIIIYSPYDNYIMNESGIKFARPFIEWNELVAGVKRFVRVTPVIEYVESVDG